MRDESKTIARAREMYAVDGEIEVDQNAVVSRGDDAGAQELKQAHVMECRRRQARLRQAAERQSFTR